MIPLDDAPFRMEVDASDYPIGGILSQKINDKWRPVAYMSQALSEAERNYEIYDKEMLAIMKNGDSTSWARNTNLRFGPIIEISSILGNPKTSIVDMRDGS